MTRPLPSTVAEYPTEKTERQLGRRKQKRKLEIDKIKGWMDGWMDR
jgi:hypothetical protein